MANKSDHDKQFTDINQYLPEVYRSNIGTSVFDAAFNRHLTKDDTSRVTGFVGEKNNNATVDRRIKESTPHRQAFQLAPTMYSNVGTEESSLSFKAFLQQLSLMGVDTNRLDTWGSTLQFNWVPPVNVDMLVNFKDYFWRPANPTAQPQYLTIENRCNKARSKVESYANVLAQRGEAFPVIRINHASSELVISGKQDDLFVPGFIFYTKNSFYGDGTANPNMQGLYWNVVSSAYDAANKETSIRIQEANTNDVLIPVFASEAEATLIPTIGWYYNTTTKTVFKRVDANTWIATSAAMLLTISLTERLQLFQAQANCACSADIGWDITRFDDNAWEVYTTSATAPLSPTDGSMWLDTTTDTLKQYDASTSTWQTAVVDYSTTDFGQKIGTTRWDKDTSCVPQQYNQWSLQNEWVHKSELTSTSGAIRAKLPILEYDSRVELNEWVRANYSWKYRAEVDHSFEATSQHPSRLELEPIKGYVADYNGTEWLLFLFHKNSTMNRDADYTDTFAPGFRFRITDDAGASEVYTVASVEYKEITDTGDYTATVKTEVGINTMCTIVTITEAVFNSALIAGNLADVIHTRIEPIRTTAGDAWRGYHAHWVLDDQAITFTPVKHQRTNLYLQRSLDTAVSLTPTIEFQARAAGVAHQEYTVGASNVQQINLLPELMYDPAIPRLYATPGSNELRVYINGVRQYGNYTELTATGKPNYTVIGQNSYDNTTPIVIEYVTGIVFDQTLKVHDTVRIEVGSAPFNCMGNSSVPVRTVEDETEFALAVAAGTQPAYRSMTQCYRLEQSKTMLNQYPSFNVFDVTTSEVVAANSVFNFKEDSDSAINTSIQRRITATADGREYVFEQHLVDRDDNILYAYKNTTSAAEYWYSPLTNKVLHWDGYAWTDRVIVTVSSGIAVRRIIVSNVTPTTTLDKSIWFNTALNQVFTYSSASGNWSAQLVDVAINGTDPMLRTIWRHGFTSADNYIPAYVDADGNATSKLASTGDWEVVDQWRYNPEHANHKEVKYSQLITHFSSIIQSQPDIPGLQSGGVYTLSQDEFDYGVGGTIKEHNNGFDTLISAVNVNNVTPLGILDFAAQEYASSIMRIRDIFNDAAVDTFSRYDRETFVDFTGTISNDVISTYESNDFTAHVYGDSSSYDAAAGKGIKNWIATIPMLGLGPKYRPHMNVDGSNVYLFHHDGHRSQVYYSPAEQDRFARAICNTIDVRSSVSKLGVISASSYPSTQAAFLSAFGGKDMRPGVYWYKTTQPRALYRFSAYDVSAVEPSIYDINGVEIPDGVMYFNKTDDVTYRKTNGVWVSVSAYVGDISMLWKEVSLAQALGEVLLEVEMRLYDVSPSTTQVFDYSSLTVTDADKTVYDELMRRRYDAYVSSREITAPLVNAEYVAGDAFTWNYATSTIAEFPRVVNGVDTPAIGTMADLNVSAWQELYTRVYGTPYPHMEPWKLQGFKDKPTWWDEEYLDTTGTRRWKTTYDATVTPTDPSMPDTDTSAGMWENIRTGFVPIGRTYPDGSIRTGNYKPNTMPMYRYFSVNISNVIVGGFAPDAVLPPYFSALTADPQVRSLFTLDNQVVNQGGDYAFGDVGPTEWLWSVSANQPYDLPNIAFIMQPAKFLHAAFGPIYTLVDGLQVDSLFKQVYSHTDALFHGDIYNTNDVYLVRGMNQWYVNYNRYTGFDTNAEFRELWAGWEPRMTYQFGGIVDTSSFEIANKDFDVTDQDYNIVLANSGVIKDVWADAFEVSLLSIPPAVINHNNQHMWKMELDSIATIPRNIMYYGVRHYPVTIDAATNTFTANSIAIVGVDTTTRRIYVSGDHTFDVTTGKSIAVTGSTGNNGAYTVTSAVYESANNKTRITVAQPVTSVIADGNVSYGITLPWLTGDVVVMSSSKFLPSPLKPDTAYYIIRVSATTFKLAETYQDAITGTAIDIVAKADGVSYVSQVASSFNVFGGAGNTAELWFHYALDKNDIRTFAPPTTVTGMQVLINILDGYSAYQNDSGVINTGADANDFDPLTGRLVDWQLETERFVDWAYGLRQSRVRVSDRYDVSVNANTNEFSFIGMAPQWTNGTAVKLYTTGTLPQPLLTDAVYYIVTVSPGVFKLSVSANAFNTAAYVDITMVGTGQLSVSLNDARRAYPRFEVNPYRNNILIDTPQGVLSNVIEGPYSDIRVQQTLFDQYSRPLTPSQIVVYRRDKQSRIAIRPEIQNDVDQIYKNDPYNYIHVGGGHFFIEGYEHFLVFNNYTSGGDLVYDPFLGLNTKRFTMDYLEKTDYTLRPTLGGYYLIDQQFNRNIEGAASDMQLYYDTHELSETSEVAARARGLLGFRGRSSFLDMLNVNHKTQFLFYRGMIQTKGSVNSVKAYINSRRFVDAKLDDFWAWKVAEFGAAHERSYPEVNLFTDDSIVGDIRLEFLKTGESETDPAVVSAIDKGFHVVTPSSTERWHNSPEQLAEIDLPLFLDAEVSSLTSIFVNNAEPNFTSIHVDYWFDTNANVLKHQVNGLWVEVLTKLAFNGTDTYYFQHDVTCDDVRIIYKPVNVLTEVIDSQNVSVLTNSKVNSDIARISSSHVINGSIIEVYAINVAKTKISPAKLVDKDSDVVVQQLPIWDPARGHHSPLAAHVIDLQASVDPARYSHTINPQQANANNFWNQEEVGTTWLDTSVLGYMPYYDDKVYADINDRLYNWGKLAPWSDVKVYQWTKSTVPPANWTAVGTPKSSVFVRTRAAAVTTTVDFTQPSNVFSVPVGSFTAGDTVVFVDPVDGTLPTGVSALSKYTVGTITSGDTDTFDLIDPFTETTIAITGNGTAVGGQKLIKAFDVNDWKEQPLLRDRVTIINNTTWFVTPAATLTWTPANIADWTVTIGSGPAVLTPDTVVDVYKNGVLLQAGVIVSLSTSTTLSITLASVPTISESDTVDIVRTVRALTTEEESFDPDAEDDGSRTVQWKKDYQFSTNTTLTNAADVHSTHTTKYYYFWVEGSSVRGTTPLSTSEVASQIKNIPGSYLVVQRPVDEAPMLTGFVTPIMYREAVLRNVATHVNDDGRYVIRFTRDKTMRNKARSGMDMAKAKHEEWMLFRRQQLDPVPRGLWDRLVESLVGYKLNDATVRVPALERELYDAANGTDTQYGLGVDQTFVNGKLGLATVVAYLQDPANDFAPVDIDTFFATYSFDTPANIIAAMDAIYVSFAPAHVNAIWFETLHDSLSMRSKYDELMKTSWIALHGIRVLEVGGMFDD